VGIILFIRHATVLGTPCDANPQKAQGLTSIRLVGLEVASQMASEVVVDVVAGEAGLLAKTTEIEGATETSTSGSATGFEKIGAESATAIEIGTGGTLIEIDDPRPSEEDAHQHGISEIAKGLRDRMLTGHDATLEMAPP
jgi:hypothetical protein